MIKVRLGGPKAGRWMHYCRWLWMKHNGAVPRGKRIYHLDGERSMTSSPIWSR